jgi:hypothetical protein
MALAGYKMISILFLIVVVALAVGSPAFATDDEAFLTFTPPAACPGERVIVTIPPDDIVGGGISVAAVSPLSYITPVLSSDPVGLIANPVCSIPEVGSLVQGASFGNMQCTFVVSESACGHYTVTATFSLLSRVAFSGQFDVPSACCAVVGGCVQPVNTFALLSPWLVAIGLIGCVGTVVVVAKKRHP